MITRYKHINGDIVPIRIAKSKYKRKVEIEEFEFIDEDSRKRSCDIFGESFKNGFSLISIKNEIFVCGLIKSDKFFSSIND